MLAVSPCIPISTIGRTSDLRERRTPSHPLSLLMRGSQRLRNNVATRLRFHISVGTLRRTRILV